MTLSEKISGSVNIFSPDVLIFVQVEERACELEEMEARVEKVWEETRLLYEEDLEMVLLQRELEQAERWLSSYENTLMAEDYGVSQGNISKPFLY